ncbi:MAG: hypothetical protein M3P33_01385, partial [bacterium]|nr:hypothetical protein [bacterium]
RVYSLPSRLTVDGHLILLEQGIKTNASTVDKARRKGEIGDDGRRLRVTIAENPQVDPTEQVQRILQRIANSFDNTEYKFEIVCDPDTQTNTLTEEMTVLTGEVRSCIKPRANDHNPNTSPDRQILQVDLLLTHMLSGRKFTVELQIETTTSRLNRLHLEGVSDPVYKTKQEFKPFSVNQESGKAISLANAQFPSYITGINFENMQQELVNLERNRIKYDPLTMRFPESPAQI